MNVRKITRSLFLLAAFAGGCERVEYYEDKPLGNMVTRVLAHKGGGSSFGEGNSFESCVYGLNKLDGIEVDVQRSKDNVLWLSHSSELPPCNSFQGACFASMQKASIQAIDSCLGPSVNFTTLETLFKYVNEKHPEKYLSLDVKAWKPCELDGINVTREMNKLADEIISLTAKYNLQHHVMVESETGDFLYYVKKHCDFIETYLTAFGDFELGAARAIDAGFTGISFQFNFKEIIVKEQVDLLHRKGLKIQAWTIYGSADLDQAKALGIDFIQTDDL